MITFDNNTKKTALPPLVKVNQVTKLLSVSKTTVHNLIDSGDLKAGSLNSSAKTRKHVLVTSASVEALYQKRFGHSLLRALANPPQT